MAWKPKEDRVVLKGITPEKMTASGLHIPLEAQKTSIWEVLAIGPVTGVKTEIVLKEGDLVMISDAAGMDIEVDGEEQRVVRFSDIHLYNDEPKTK